MNRFVDRARHAIGTARAAAIDAKQVYGQSWLRSYVDIAWCTAQYSASPNNYRWFGFAGLESEQRSTYMTHRDSQALIRALNDPAYRIVFQDKVLFAQVFRRYLGENRRVLAIERISDVTTLEGVLGSSGRVVYKPRRGGQGRGIQVLRIDQFPGVDEMLEYILSLGSGLVESWIEQHSALSEVYPDAVSTVRVKTVYEKGQCHVLEAYLAVGNGAAIANASAGAIYSLVDVATGTVSTAGADSDGRLHDRHPSTGAAIKGMIIPDWDAIVQLVMQAATEVPMCGYIGWDVAVTPTGPILIEGNDDPGYVYQQHRSLNPGGPGNRAVYEPFLQG